MRRQLKADDLDQPLGDPFNIQTAIASFKGDLNLSSVQMIEERAHYIVANPAKLYIKKRLGLENEELNYLGDRVYFAFQSNLFRSSERGLAAFAPTVCTAVTDDIFGESSTETKLEFFEK